MRMKCWMRKGIIRWCYWVALALVRVHCFSIAHSLGHAMLRSLALYLSCWKCVSMQPASLGLARKNNSNRVCWLGLANYWDYLRELHQCQRKFFAHSF